MIIYNQVFANTPMHKEPLGWAWYTAPRIFGYGAQMKRLEQHDSNLSNRWLHSRQLPQEKHRTDIPLMLQIGLMGHPWTKKKPAATMLFLSRNNNQTPLLGQMYDQRR